MTTILIFLIVIIVLVVIHELGHLLVAKAFGVRVDEFGVGYPPRAGKLFTWRGTLFTLNWLPFGGFVKIFGEEHGGTETADSFAHKSMGKRVLIIAAGILSNFLLAGILYALSFGIGFLGSANDFPGSVAVGAEHIIVTDVLAGSPASDAGLASGDFIEKIAAGDGSITPTTVDEMIAFIQNHGDEPLTFSITHKKNSEDISITPKAGVVEGKPGIGVALAQGSVIRLPFFQSIKQGFSYAVDMTVSTVRSLGAIVSGAFRGDNGLLSQVSGPVGIAEVAGQAFSLGFGSLLSFAALISINLAVINLLPFPALDGGRIILELFARDGRSRIPKKVVSAVNQVGFLLLIVFMVYVTYKDIVRLIA